MYSIAYGNALQVQRMWRKQFRTQPLSHQTIRDIAEKFDRTASVKNLPHERRKTVAIESSKRRVLAAYERSPKNH
jgi:hypothetical protein